MTDAVAAGAWPEKENANAGRISQITEHIKQVIFLEFIFSKIIIQTNTLKGL